MATAKQLAALAKGRKALAAKRRKKNPAKRKPRAKKAVTSRSQITKKPPSKRLKARRRANTKKGYFPNPVRAIANYWLFVAKPRSKTRYYVQKVGAKVVLDTSKPLGMTKQMADNLVISVKNRIPPGYGLYLDKKKRSTKTR